MQAFYLVVLLTQTCRALQHLSGEVVQHYRQGSALFNETNINTENIGTAKSSVEALLLFRTLELWMNLHLGRSRDCLHRTMCEGNKNIVSHAPLPIGIYQDPLVVRMYAEVARYDIRAVI